MALDHSRLGLENKSGRIFCVRQVYFTKSCQQIWVRANQTLILFIHHIRGERVLSGAVCIIQTSYKMQQFTICQDKLHSFNILDHQSTRRLLTKPFKKFPKSPTAVYGLPVMTFDKRQICKEILRVTLQHDKGFIVFMFC